MMWAVLLMAMAVVGAHAKVFERCELARELLHQHRIPAAHVGIWVCIARYESEFNSSAVGHAGGDGSGDHGLFQISDLYWCSPPGRGRACGLPCSALEDDDIGDDMACVKRIYREHKGLSGNGFNAWAVYPLYCRRKDRVAELVEGCFDGNVLGGSNELGEGNLFHGAVDPEEERKAYGLSASVPVPVRGPSSARAPALRYGAPPAPRRGFWWMFSHVRFPTWSPFSTG